MCSPISRSCMYTFLYIKSLVHLVEWSVGIWLRWRVLSYRWIGPVSRASFKPSFMLCIVYYLAFCVICSEIHLWSKLFKHCIIIYILSVLIVIMNTSAFIMWSIKHLKSSVSHCLLWRPFQIYKQFKDVWLLSTCLIASLLS